MQYEELKISHNLRKFREGLRYSKATVAKKIDTTRSNLTRWEEGTLPSVKYLARLAKLYSVSLDQLVYGKKDGRKKACRQTHKSKEGKPFHTVYIDLNNNGMVSKCEEKFSDESDISEALNDDCSTSIIIRRQMEDI